MAEGSKVKHDLWLLPLVSHCLTRFNMSSTCLIKNNENDSSHCMLNLYPILYLIIMCFKSIINENWDKVGNSQDVF